MIRSWLEKLQRGFNERLINRELMNAPVGNNYLDHCSVIIVEVA